MEQLSREEIIEDIVDNSDCIIAIFTENQKEVMHKVMDIYAKQTAIAFEQWKLENKYYTPLDGSQSGQYFNKNGEGIAKDIKTIFELYTQSLNK